MARLLSWLARPALLKALIGRLRLAVRLVREPRVAPLAKALGVLPLIYLISPIDVLPDVLPVLGQLDDLGVILFAIESFIRLAPTDVVAHHQTAVEAGRPYAPMRPPRPEGSVIDADFRRG